MKGAQTYQKLADILGLSGYEARIYLAAAGIGQPASLTELARRSGISRTAAYPPVLSLVRKGLISVSKIGKRPTYQSLDPRRLENVLDRKKIDLDQIVSQLSRNLVLPKENMSVKYFAGKRGIASAGDVFLADTKTKMWKTFETSMFDPDSMDPFQFEDYIKRRATKGIFARVIISAKVVYPWFKERLNKDKEELRENILVSDDDYPFHGALGITKGMILYNNTVGEPFAVIIKNEQMAEMLESVHDLIWSRYKGNNAPASDKKFG